LADDIEIAPGELAPDLADQGSRRGHPIDLTPAYPQAFL
jgi:hypothetical protein